MKEKFKNIVGAGDSARPQKRNTQKGITLIALIISIIVMLILAVVSINIIMNQGIMTKSKDAADTHQIAAEKEAINIGYSEYLTKKYNGETPTLTVADANVQENANEWTITFNAEPKNVYKLSKNGEITKQNGTEEQVPQELVAYLVGENGKNIFDLIEIVGSTGPNSFKDTGDANLQLEYVNILEGEQGYINIIFIYKEKMYYLTVDGKELNTKEVKYIGNLTEMPEKIEEGAKLRIDGINYTILYVNNDGTVEIVADYAIGNLTLGYEDEKAVGNNNFEKAVNSYNNAVTRINEYCESLYKDENGNYKNSNIISVRSVGSNRSNPNGDTTQMYTDENISTWNCKYEGESVTVDRVGKVEDNNYEEDYNKMKELGIEACGQSYWLASRHVETRSYRVGFYVMCMSGGSDMNYGTFWEANSNGSMYASDCNGCVRPVLKMNASALSSN